MPKEKVTEYKVKGRERKSKITVTQLKSRSLKSMTSLKLDTTISTTKEINKVNEVQKVQKINTRQTKAKLNVFSTVVQNRRRNKQ